MKHTKALRCMRRQFLTSLLVLPAFAFQNEPGDWICPMDPDVHMDQPGKCPRCGMTLALKIPDRLEYPVTLTVEPRNIKPGDEAHFTLRVTDPSGARSRKFETVHERLMHLFVVSEDLEFFAHVHPQAQADGSFILSMVLPKSGMYRLLADYYPSGSVPQLSAETIYVPGTSHPARLQAGLVPEASENLTATLRLEPETLLAGIEARLIYSLEPNSGLEQYLGAWGHMLIVSEDTIDLIHLHPFLVSSAGIQYNAIFPRAGNYKVWSQFQRLGVVNTVAISLNVKEI